MHDKGIFIVFEGIDGCGKTTQISKLVSYLFLKNKYNSLLCTREPTSLYKQIRENLEYHEDLFIEDRKYHIENCIIPNIHMGNIVICDRYKYSTYVYQYELGNHKKDFNEFITEIDKKQENFLIPNIVFYLKTIPELARNRNNDSDFIDKDLDLQKKLSNHYDNLMDIFIQRQEPIYIINANMDIEYVFTSILVILKSKYPNIF